MYTPASKEAATRRVPESGCLCSPEERKIRHYLDSHPDLMFQIQEEGSVTFSVIGISDPVTVRYKSKEAE